MTTELEEVEEEEDVVRSRTRLGGALFRTGVNMISFEGSVVVFVVVVEICRN